MIKSSDFTPNTPCIHWITNYTTYLPIICQVPDILGMWCCYSLRLVTGLFPNPFGQLPRRAMLFPVHPRLPRAARPVAEALAGRNKRLLYCLPSTIFRGSISQHPRIRGFFWFRIAGSSNEDLGAKGESLALDLKIVWVGNRLNPNEINLYQTI